MNLVLQTNGKHASGDVRQMCKQTESKQTRKRKQSENKANAKRKQHENKAKTRRKQSERKTSKAKAMRTNSQLIAFSCILGLCWLHVGTFLAPVWKFWLTLGLPVRPWDPFGRQGGRHRKGTKNSEKVVPAGRAMCFVMVDQKHVFLVSLYGARFWIDLLGAFGTIV